MTFSQNIKILRHTFNPFHGIPVCCGTQFENPALKNTIFHMAKPALLVVTDSKGETLVLDKFHDHSDYVLIWKGLKQLAGKATVPDRFICHH